jgi:hypothetical protein
LQPNPQRYYGLIEFYLYKTGLNVMKTRIHQVAAAMLMLLAVSSADARPIALPDASNTIKFSGSFTVDADKTLTLTGSPVSLKTSAGESVTDINHGKARFMSGTLQYADGIASVDGKLSRLTLGSQVSNGMVVYVLKGLVYGTLTEQGKTIDVNGSVGITTKPAPEGTELDQTQVESGQVVVTTRSNINNPAQ